MLYYIVIVNGYPEGLFSDKDLAKEAAKIYIELYNLPEHNYPEIITRELDKI